MTVIAVASAKGRGVTTVAELLVQLRTTGRRCVLIDADPAGGDWLLRPGVTPEPGLLSLAIAGRRRLENGELFSHVQVVGSVELVVGPAPAHQASWAVETTGDRLVAHLRALVDDREGGWAGPVDSVIDCGRLAPGSPALPLALQADLLVLVSPATAAGLVHLAPLVAVVREAGRQPAVVLHGGASGEARYDGGEVAAGVGAEVLGAMAEDPGAAGRLAAQPGRVDGLGRSRLVRSMAEVSARAWERAGQLESGPAGGGPRPSRAEDSLAPIGWREQR